MTSTAPREHSIKCGSCKGTHRTRQQVRDCYTDARGGFLDLREAADQQAAEVWAENAWLRHAEGWHRVEEPEPVGVAW